jgi:N-acetylglutamate synthase-like GNAT family acetyltransferase
MGEIEYREPKNQHELEALFRLRYTVYSADENLHAMVSSSTKHDINEFDINALHYGAFEGSNAIACIRIITTAETRFSPWIKDLISRFKIVLDAPKASFPFQLYYPSPDWCLGFINDLNGRKIGEVGKLAIDKNYRKGGNVLNDLVSSFVHYCKNDQKFNTGFGICTHELERYYRKFGFSIVEGSVPFISDGLPEAVIVRFDN